MDTTRFVFFSALFASLLLAAPAFTDPPSPTPTPTTAPAPAWTGMGELQGITDKAKEYRLWACTFQVRQDSLNNATPPFHDTADQQCHPVKHGVIDWSSDETRYGTVKCNFDTGPGTDYLWAQWSNQASVYNPQDQDMSGLLETPYEDPTTGVTGVSYTVQVCTRSNLTSAQLDSIAFDYISRGGTGTGLCGTSCPTRSLNNSHCFFNVGTCSGFGCCYCSDDILYFTAFDQNHVCEPGSTLSCKSYAPPEGFFSGGKIIGGKTF